MLVPGILGIILVGSVLLSLPVSSKEGTATSFFDCLFTATSAACVTGLNVFDPYTQWSIFGQIVLTLLIQVGGLGFVTIITFFNIAAGKKLGYRTIASAADGLTESSFKGGREIFISIMKYSLIFELCGALLMMIVFIPRYGAYGIWISVFMSISAFCNAGFDLMGIEQPFSSLTSLNGEPLLLIVISLLTIVGGLGFIVWENFINYKKVKKLSLHTFAVLIMTAILVVGGTLLYLLAEWNNPATIGNMSFADKLLNSFFSSAMTRSSGFNSVAVNELTDFSLLGTIFLMFIGSAPASTGGGIKVTTLLVLVMTVVSYIKNKNDVEIFHHKIDKLTVYRAIVITVLSMCAVCLCFAVLYCTPPEGIDTIHIIFEAVSTFSTAGLSIGESGASGITGKLVLMLTMITGRVGPVALIMSLTMNSGKRKNIIVPEGQIIIG